MDRVLYWHTLGRAQRLHCNFTFGPCHLEMDLLHCHHLFCYLCPWHVHFLLPTVSSPARRKYLASSIKQRKTVEICVSEYTNRP